MTFDGCESLEYITFGGNKAQWEAIEIKGNNNPLQDAKKYYNYETAQIIAARVTDTGDGVTVKCRVMSPPLTGASAICALYDNGKMTGVRLVTLGSNNEEFVLSFDNAPYTEIHLYAVGPDFAPLCGALLVE